MSWAEVFKINNNLKHPINKQLTDREFNIGQLITDSTEWIVPKTGIYKIICVGKGASSGSNYAGGGAGGVVIEKATLEKGDNYTITISGSASFGNLCIAEAASGTEGGGGSATNGIVYKGENGTLQTNGYYGHGGNVGLYDKRYVSEAEQCFIATQMNARGGNGLFGGKQSPIISVSDNNVITHVVGGAGGYGGGAGTIPSTGGNAGKACVYIELIEEQ